MSKLIKIKLSSDINFLSECSEFQDLIADKAIINKKITGCGYTESLIRSNDNWIIAEPYRSIGRSKEFQHTTVFNFNGETLKKDLKKYIDSNNRYCIFVTYDSVKKLKGWLDSITNVDFSLAIDEEWELTKSYIFRNNAIKSLLDSVCEFKRVQLCSATPFDETFQLNEFKSFTRYELEWDRVEEVKVNMLQSKYVLDLVRVQILSELESSKGFNYYYFYNSVSDICKIVKECGLTPDNCRIVCAKEEKNKAKLPTGFSIGTPEDEPRLFNFSTSTALSGVDWYDENGRIFAVCNAHHPHSQFDISTQIAQLAGRIRNSKYKNEIGIIWSPNKYNQNVSQEEFKNACEKVLNNSKQVIDEYNLNSESAVAKKLKERISKQELFDDYLIVKGNELVLDENIFKFDLLTFKLNHYIYTSYIRLEKEFKNNGFKVENNLKWMPNEEDLIKWGKSENESFRDIINSLNECKLNWNYDSWLQIEYYTSNFNEYVNIFNALGYDKIKEMNFHLGNSRRCYIRQSNHSQSYKDYKLINLEFKEGEWYSNKLIKDKLIRVGAGKKATDIEKYFEVKESKRLVRGKRENGMVLIRKTFCLK